MLGAAFGTGLTGMARLDVCSLLCALQKRNRRDRRRQAGVRHVPPDEHRGLEGLVDVTELLTTYYSRASAAWGSPCSIADKIRVTSLMRIKIARRRQTHEWISEEA